MYGLHLRRLLLALTVALALSSCRGGGGPGGRNVLPPSSPVFKQSTGDYATAVLADNPTQYFKLMDSSGPTALDSSATAVNGTYVGGVTYGVAGPLLDEASTAVGLPGGTASVGVSLPNPNATSGKSYSIQTWVYPLLSSSYMTVWGYDGYHRLLVNNNGLLLSQFGGGAYFSKTALTGGTWHDVVFVYDAQKATQSYYVDGVLDSSAALSNSAAAFTSAYFLGQYNTGTYYKWHGNLGQHAFYPAALTASQVATLHAAAGYGSAPPPTPTPAPTASPSPSASSGTYAAAILQSSPTQYFNLTETSGPTAFDSSTTAINGTYVGAVTYSAPGPLLDEPSTAISLPGGTSSVGVSLPNPSASAGTSYSIETWVYPILGSSYMTIWGFDGYHRLLVNNNGLLLSQFGGGAYFSKTALTGGQWHDVVFVYNAPAATASYYIDGVLDSSASLSTSSAAFTSSYYLGQYNTGTYYKWHGSLGQHAFFRSALTPTQIANMYATAGYGSASPSATPSPVPSYTDWSTFGDGLARTNYNPNETTLNAANASKIKLAWSADLGSAITAQPVLATNVNIGGKPQNVLYVGTEGGVFYALNPDTGATIWSKALASVTSGCMDLPGGTFGISETATFDKSTNRVYVADGHAQVHALDMSTGNESAGWPVTVVSSFTKNHIYAALTYNPANGLLYASTGSYCDQTTWFGTLVAINTSSASIVNTFVPATPYSGDGMWGIGGAAVDSSNNIYVATGNTIGGAFDYSAYGDQMLKLSPNLSVLAAAVPPHVEQDQDFGATPMLYQPPGCVPMVSGKQKSGEFLTYSQSGMSGAPMQDISMAPPTEIGEFIGVTAYSPATNLVYVGDPHGGVAPFSQGLIALSVQSGCSLALAWQQTVGPVVSSDDNDSPTVANGVVYFTDGVANQAFAFDASTGQMLWNSGSIIGGPVMTAPTVDGRLFVSSWDHHLYAFGL